MDDAIVTVAALVEIKPCRPDATCQAITDEQRIEARNINLRPFCFGTQLRRGRPLGKRSWPGEPQISVRQLPRDDRRWQRRASIIRASVVLALLGLFCGSASLMSEKPQLPPDAARVSPPAGAPAPVQAHAKAAWPALSALSLSEMTYCLRSEDPGGVSVAKPLIAYTDTDPGAHHARSC